MILVLKFIIGIIFFSSATLAVEHQQLKLAVPFTDSMILQRECEVPVWGFDVHGNKVTVEFGGQIKTAVADKWGRWMVKLDPLKASLNERSMEVSNDKGKSISQEKIKEKNYVSLFMKYKIMLKQYKLVQQDEINPNELLVKINIPENSDITRFEIGLLFDQYDDV